VWELADLVTLLGASGWRLESDVAPYSQARCVNCLDSPDRDRFYNFTVLFQPFDGAFRERTTGAVCLGILEAPVAIEGFSQLKSTF
jgi:hypothetical protein